MAQTVTNVSAAKPKIGGAIYVAASGTTMPTDCTTALASTFKCLGYISNDGLTNNNTPNTGSVIAWGGDEVLTLYNEKKDEFQFKLLEVLNVDVLKTIYGDSNVTGTLTGSNGITVQATNQMLPSLAFVAEIAMGNGVSKRICIADASVSNVGALVYKDSDAVAYDITISAKPDANGVTHKEYIKKTSS